MVIRVTPLDRSGNMVELSKGTGIYQKQVIPFGTFGYKGSTFTIDENWADEAIRAFNDKALDLVPFAFADENNSHHVDDRPDRFAGEVIGLTKTAEGIDAIIKPTNESAKVIDDTDHKLGVSIRFTEPYVREADGKSWPVAIDQVLGTLSPRITGMKPWQEIVLSNVANPNDVQDASDGEWTVAQPNNDNPVTLTQQEYAWLKKQMEAGPNDLATDKDVAITGEEDLPDILKQVEDLAKQYENVDNNDNDNDKPKQAVGLSNDRRIVELSAQVAESKFDRDALMWKQAGVPPAIIELARPVLSSWDEVKVVTLSNNQESTVDARTVVRKILDECKGTIDLSAEKGNNLRQPTQDSEYDAFLKAATEQATQF